MTPKNHNKNTQKTPDKTTGQNGLLSGQSVRSGQQVSGNRTIFANQMKNNNKKPDTNRTANRTRHPVSAPAPSLRGRAAVKTGQKAGQAMKGAF